MNLSVASTYKTTCSLFCCADRDVIVKTLVRAVLLEDKSAHMPVIQVSLAFQRLRN